MSKPSLYFDGLRYFRWRWTKLWGEMNDKSILDRILDDKPFCDVRFKRIVMLSQGSTGDESDEIALLLWEYCGHNPQHLYNMWQWAEHLKLFKQDASQRIKYIRKLWGNVAKAETAGEGIDTGSKKFEDEFTSQPEDPSLISFSRELYRAYKEYLALVAGFDQDPDAELQRFFLEYPFYPRESLRTGSFEVGLDCFLLEEYLAETHILLETGWKVLKLGCDLELSFLSSAPEEDPQAASLHLLNDFVGEGEQERQGEGTLVFDVAGSGKTQRIFDWYSKSYGHYLVAPGPKDNPTTPEDHRVTAKCEPPRLDQDVLRSRRGSASRDMELLYRYSIPTHSYDGLAAGSALVVSSTRLKFNRDIMLMQFRRKLLRHQSTLDKVSQTGPQKWMLFQTVCGSDSNGFDSFHSALQILLLVDNYIDVLELSPSTWWPIGSSIVCLDEAQLLLKGQPKGLTDLDYILRGASKPFREDTQDKKYTCWYSWSTRYIISGTSLRLEECTSILNRLLEDKHERKRLKWGAIDPAFFKPFSDNMSLMKVTDLSFLVTDQQFESLSKSHTRRVMGRILYLRQLGRDKVESYGFAEILLPAVYHTSADEFFDNGMGFLDGLPKQTLDHAVKTIENYFMAEERKPWVIKYSLLLRGRYRWSVLYIEHLLAYYLKLINTPEPMSIDQAEDTANSRDFPASQLGPSEATKEPSDRDEMILDSRELIKDRDESIDDSDITSNASWITEQSKHCQDVIKSALRRRLEELEEGRKVEHTYMLEDLYWTAIRADLMHKPSILQDRTGGQLITEGFARMDSFSGTADEGRTAVKQKLAEPLAVAAVVEHLRAQQRGRYKNMLKRLLFDNQDDASSIGKTAEYFLAWSFGGLLRCDPEDPHLAPESRRLFTEILNNAKLVTASPDLGQQLNLIDYNLHMPPPDAPKTHELGQLPEFHEWLQNIRKEAFFPTFYFPSKFAGPDIVFTLKHNDPAVKTTILCAIQLKTGKSCQKNDAAKVVSTIDPNLWFASKPGKNMKSALEDEIRLWQGTLEIMTVLFTTSVSIQEFFAFKDYSVLPNSGSGVGKSVLDEALQIIAEGRRTSLSEEDGKRIIEGAHQTVTGKPWVKRAKKDAGQLARDTSAMDLDGLSISGNVAQDDVGGQQNAVPRTPFRFATLERRHTAVFFGESVDELISLVKDLKENEPEDEGEELDPEELVALTAEAKKLTVNALKHCLKESGSSGYSQLPKEGLVELLVQKARRFGFDEVLNLIKDTARLKLTKRAANESLIAGSIKKGRTE